MNEFVNKKIIVFVMIFDVLYNLFEERSKHARWGFKLRLV